MLLFLFLCLQIKKKKKKKKIIKVHLDQGWRTCGFLSNQMWPSVALSKDQLKLHAFTIELDIPMLSLKKSGGAI